MVSGLLQHVVGPEFEVVDFLKESHDLARRIHSPRVSAGASAFLRTPNLFHESMRAAALFLKEALHVSLDERAELSVELRVF